MIWQRNITIFNRESIFNRYFFPLPCQFTNRVSGKSRWWFLKYVCHLSPLTLRFQFFIQFEDCAYMFDSWVGGKNHLSSHCWGWFCSNNPPISPSAQNWMRLGLCPQYQLSISCVPWVQRCRQHCFRRPAMWAVGVLGAPPCQWAWQDWKRWHWHEPTWRCLFRINGDRNNGLVISPIYGISLGWNHPLPPTLGLTWKIIPWLVSGWYPWWA